jgi:hypothetical protein
VTPKKRGLQLSDIQRLGEVVVHPGRLTHCTVTLKGVGMRAIILAARAPRTSR